MSKMGSHDPFEHLKHKLWLKEGSGIDPISSRVGGMQHTIRKLSTRAITFLQNSLQSEVWTQSYGPPKSHESHMWEFQDSHLGVWILGQNAIWMWSWWRGIENTIRGKVVASPKSKPWWILWVQGWPWHVLAPKMLKLCINQLVVWFL